MKTKFQQKTIAILMVLSLVLLSGCGVLSNAWQLLGEEDVVSLAPEPTVTSTPIPSAPEGSLDALQVIQNGFSSVYAAVLPSVVNIQVVQEVSSGGFPQSEGLPFPFNAPDQGEPFQRSALGSGFVWDLDGHIVTNNHVVRNADRIRVTFSDGTSLEGELVGADQDSDLAVIKVDASEDRLSPVQVGDSTSVEVGQLVAAIGNPFGLQGTMTLGVISALGRSLPVQSSTFQGTSYTIPDVIQTDAPINPGNSGGVLVDMEGALIGVPTAIESSSGVNAGIGFVVPSIIVQKVVPVLIEEGEYEHPWIGISGTTLQSELAEQMDLPRDQRGVLVAEVVPESPADKAGLIGSDRITEINGQEVRIGGDVIVQIEDRPVRDFEDLTAYLARYTNVGETISLTVIREGQQITEQLKLAPRPGDPEQAAQRERRQSARAWLGIYGITMSPSIAREMELPADLEGVLIQQIIEGSPADQAGLQGSYQSIMIEGQQVLIGGDIITSLEKQEIRSMQELIQVLGSYQPGDQVKAAILRNGEEMIIEITLGERPETGS